MGETKNAYRILAWKFLESKTEKVVGDNIKMGV
jgi:hypothetical protein